MPMIHILFAIEVCPTVTPKQIDCSSLVTLPQIAPEVNFFMH